MKIKAVVFDVDGTLVNADERFFHFYGESLEHFGIQAPDRETYLERKKLGKLDDVIPKIDGAREKFWLRFIDRYSSGDYDNIGHPYPGVPDALDRLSTKGYPMSIVTGRTGAPERVVSELERMGIHHHFHHVLTNNNGVKGMNKAAKLVQSARLLGLKPIKCAYIGDWEGDIHGAREAGYGLKISVLTGGEDRDSLIKSNPDIILDSAADLPVYLERFEKTG